VLTGIRRASDRLRHWSHRRRRRRVRIHRVVDYSAKLGCRRRVDDVGLFTVLPTSRTRSVPTVRTLGFDFHCLLHRKVSRWFILQDSRGVNANLATRLGRKLRVQLSRLYRSKSFTALSQRMASMKTST
jgi:hypothetical protein